MWMCPTSSSTVPDPAGDARRAELAANLAALKERVAAACAVAGRDPAEVHIIAVTKTYPASDVLHLVSLGLNDIGENRDQEAAPKAAAVAAAGATVRWHFIGQLQRNKARSVARYADLVQTVDSVRLAAALEAAAQRERETPLDVLVQVSLDGDAARGGAVVEGTDEETALDRVLEAVVRGGALRLGGLMAVAPIGADPDRAFAELAEVAQTVRARFPGATVLSAGMSSDFEQAIRHGATHIRVGSAVLGQRAPLR
jgi:pyridoxal phosphate enzyme (YggS family)